MYAVEFETHINNGVVHIPSHYKELQNSKKAKVIVMVDDLGEKNETAFNLFLQQSKKIEEIAIFSRDELHDR
jgi:hypothetical protein